LYAEPMLHLKERLRDLVVLQKGWLALLTDSARILLIRPATQEPQPWPQVHGYPTARTRANALRARLRYPTRAQGREIFRAACASCHTLDAQPGPGPHLKGIVGRPIAAVRDFKYSAGLAEKGGRWTKQLLAVYLENPAWVVYEGAMPDPGLPASKIWPLILFLE
jgi:cytochrome c2